MTTTVLAKRVSEQRRLIGMTQAEVAEVANVSLRLVKMVEAGQGNPGLQQVSRILDAIGLEINILPKA